jgi:hypothetical protein
MSLITIIVSIACLPPYQQSQLHNYKLVILRQLVMPLMLIPKVDRIEVSAILAGTMMVLMVLVTAPSVAFAASDNHHYYKQYNTNHHQGLGVYIHNDASYVKNIKITDVDRHSSHLLKVTLSRNNYNGNTPNYISVVAIGNEDKQIAGSITISSQFTDQKTVTIHLLKKRMVTMPI